MNAHRLASAGLFLCALPVAARGQAKATTTPCEFSADRFRTDSTAIGKVTFLGGSVVIRCPDRKITLRADSAEQYPNRDQMIGHAVYDEPRLHVTSDFMTFFAAEDHVNAAGNVVATLPSGSKLVGPVADYYRENPKVRPRQEIRARARPTITIVEKDSSGKPAPPMTVIADNVYMSGDSLIYGWGQVVIQRVDIGATADSAFIDEGKETMRLMRNPQVKGRKDRPFSLEGELIDMYSRNRKLERVIARAKAIATSDSLTLKADTIDLRVKNDQLDHAYAWGKTSRANAVSPTQNVIADSLDVFMPGQKIQLVRAVARAVAHSKPDTTHYRLEKADSTDWLKGDTIIAHFDTIPVKDTAKNPPIKQLVATGHASSYYHMAPNDTSLRLPAINAVTARLITIDFTVEANRQRVATVTAADSVVGIYIEPKADSTAQKPKAANGTVPGKDQPKPATPSVIIPPPPRRPPK